MQSLLVVSSEYLLGIVLGLVSSSDSAWPFKGSPVVAAVVCVVCTGCSPSSCKYFALARACTSNCACFFHFNLQVLMCNNHRRSGAEDMYYNKITLHGPRQGFVLSLVKPKHTHTIQTDSGIVSIYVGPVWNARMKNT